MSDDVSMGALVRARSPSARAPRSRPAAISCFTATAISTRCEQVAAASPLLAGRCRASARDARACRRARAGDIDIAAARATFRRADGEHAAGQRIACMTAEIIPFDAELAAERAERRARAGRRCRGLRRPARSAAHAGAPAEGRSREDLDPGARRPISRLHRGRRASCGSNLPPIIS